jgi:photosystem II stability/assembly factor-like uncharacterized protein
MEFQSPVNARPGSVTHAVLAIACAFLPHTLQSATWSAINAGLPGSSLRVASIAISPAQPSILFARTIGSGGVSALFKSTDGAATWNVLSSLVGPGSLALDPQDPAKLYAVAGSGVLRSRDGGNTWSTAGAGLPSTYISTLIVDSASNLYAVAGPGIFKSPDGGATWQSLDLALPSNAFVSSLVADPNDPSRLYALSPVPQNNGPAQVAILRSTDGGQTWNVIPNKLLGGASVTSLVISAMAPSVLFAVAPSGPSDTPIFKSSDGGNTWAPLNAGLPVGAVVNSLVIEPTNSSHLYLAVTFYFAEVGGILESSDGGATWTATQPDLPADTPLDYLAIDPSSPSIFYALANNALLKSMDGGATWAGGGSGLNAIDVFALGVSPLDASTLYASAANSLFKSQDAGATWNSIFTFQLFTPETNSIGPFFPDGSPTYPRSLLIDFSNPQNLYLDTNRGNGCYFADNLLFKSADGGATWNNGISPQYSGCILGGFFGPSGGLKAMDPTNPATLYVAEDDDGDGEWQLLKTTDGGATWNSLGDFPNNIQAGVWALAIDPTMPTTIYAAVDDFGTYTDPTTLPSGIGGVYKTTDGGMTWNSIGLSGAAVNLVVIAPGQTNILYAATMGDYTFPRGFRGLFKSTDSGATWSAIHAGLDTLIAMGANITAIAIDPTNSNLLYLGVSGGGVFKSSDGGATWIPFNAGLANVNVRILAFAPGSGHVLYAGTSGGVFKIVDNGGVQP